VCGSDLERAADELAKVQEHHRTLLNDLKERRKALNEAYRGKVPREVVAPLLAAKKQVDLSEKRNAEAFARVRERLFQRLYHEAFHAYLGNFVYPGKGFPRWFNEGLAQVFETAVVEAGELRVGHVDPERLKALGRVKLKLVPLRRLLSSGAEGFLIKHHSDEQVSNEYYRASWALAHYLTFDRKLLGTPALDEYVESLGCGTDPEEAFQTLVGQPLDEFEKEWRKYLGSLKPGGGAGK
jgi:hypothetical protein